MLATRTMNSKHITKEDINQTGNVLLGKASRLSKDDANSVLKQFRENRKFRFLYQNQQ